MTSKETPETSEVPLDSRARQEISRLVFQVGTWVSGGDEFFERAIKEGHYEAEAKNDIDMVDMGVGRREEDILKYPFRYRKTYLDERRDWEERERYRSQKMRVFIEATKEVKDADQWLEVAKRDMPELVKELGYFAAWLGINPIIGGRVFDILPSYFEKAIFDGERKNKGSEGWAICLRKILYENIPERNPESNWIKHWGRIYKSEGKPAEFVIEDSHLENFLVMYLLRKVANTYERDVEFWGEGETRGSLEKKAEGLYRAQEDFTGLYLEYEKTLEKVRRDWEEQERMMVAFAGKHNLDQERLEALADWLAGKRRKGEIKDVELSYAILFHGYLLAQKGLVGLDSDQFRELFLRVFTNIDFSTFDLAREIILREFPRYYTISFDNEDPASAKVVLFEVASSQED